MDYNEMTEHFLKIADELMKISRNLLQSTACQPSNDCCDDSSDSETIYDCLNRYYEIDKRQKLRKIEAEKQQKLQEIEAEKRQKIQEIEEFYDDLISDIEDGALD